MAKLIGIHGKPRAGKDTVANYLIEKHNYVRYGPSVRVKMTTAAMFDVPIEYLDDDKMKDAYDPFWKMTHREMMQKVGKECSRDIFGEDFWMRHVERFIHMMGKSERYKTYAGVVLADLRYANEADWVHDQGGVVLIVKRDNRPQVSNESHAAEHGLPDEYADWIIKNNSTIKQLYDSLDSVISALPVWTT